MYNHRLIIGGKVEVLVNAWDKMIGDMMTKVSRFKGQFQQ